MGIYCISDIHGCYEEFIALLDQIRFDPENDTIYVLGDAIDRGERPIDCLQYITRTKSIYFLMGNHEVMMLDYYDGTDRLSWRNNGCETTMKQLNRLSERERNKVFTYLRECPFYMTINVNGRHFFLSHSGLDVSRPLHRQTQDALIWSREKFYCFPALPGHICIFGHTPTMYLRRTFCGGGNDCSIWTDTSFNDKINIDSGCVYGGALSALCLNDGAVFYTKSNQGYNAQKYSFKASSYHPIF